MVGSGRGYSGKLCSVPSRHPVTADLPPEVQAAMRTFRLVMAHDLIHHLGHNEATPHQLAQDLNVSVNSVRRVLQQLEDDGVVIASLPPGHRAGRRITYRVNPTRGRDLLTQLADHLFPVRGTAGREDVELEGL